MQYCRKKWFSFQHFDLFVIAPLYLLQSKRRQLRDVMNINRFRNYESCGSKRGIENVLASPFALISIPRLRQSNLASTQEYARCCKYVCENLSPYFHDRRKCRCIYDN